MRIIVAGIGCHVALGPMFRRYAMQTFLPFPSFAETARILDYRRLGKQRVEVIQILNTIARGAEAKGWANHPAVIMWRGYEPALRLYGVAMCAEWIERGYRDSCLVRIGEPLMSMHPSFEMPPWLGDPDFHASHRSNLLRKNPDFYAQYGWSEPGDLPYIWPEPATW